MPHDPPLHLGARLLFERVDPAVNARRYYAMTVLPDPQLALFGETPRVMLVLLWGRIGQRLRVLRKRFASVADAEPKWRALIATRLRHGYVVLREEP